MEIGINDDFIDEIDDFANEVTPDGEEQDLIEQDPVVEEDPEESVDEDFVTSLLKAKGIDDKTKIKFENEEGSVEEVDWDTLSNEDKFNILNTSTDESETDLDDTEIELINAIRESGMTPSEYLQYLEQSTINRYIQNSTQPEYSVDQYNDEELFIADFISRMGDVTEEEAQEALERAKSNESLFRKQIDAIRKEYRDVEEENLRQAQIEQEQEAQQQYEQFTQSVVDEINDFTEFSGYDLNLEQEDMQELYDFITGTDAAGNNHFAKALSDPRILVQTAWLALNGQQMMEDITEYFQKEITRVRKDSYQKGKADAEKKINQSNVVYKPLDRSSDVYTDLDEF